MVHFDSRDLLVTLDTIAEATQIPSLPQHPNLYYLLIHEYYGGPVHAIGSWY